METADATRPAATRATPTASNGSEMLRSADLCPTSKSPGWRERVPSVCTHRPVAVTHAAQRHRGDGRCPSGERRKTKIKAVKAGHPSRGEAHAATWAQ